MHLRRSAGTIIMSYTSTEFRQFIELLHSPETFKKLRPGFLSRHKLDSSASDNSLLILKYHSNYVRFDINVLLIKELHTDTYYDFYVPYKFAIQGTISSSNTQIKSVEIESYKNTDTDPDKAERSTIRYNSENGVTRDDFAENLESQLNGNYHTLSDVEKSYFRLQGNEVVGDLLISEFEEIIDALESIAHPGIKRAKRFRVVEYAIGQWINAYDLADTESKWPKIGAAMFNGAATFQLSQLYFNLIEMFIRIS